MEIFFYKFQIRKSIRVRCRNREYLGRKKPPAAISIGINVHMDRTFPHPFLKADSITAFQSCRAVPAVSFSYGYAVGEIRFIYVVPAVESIVQRTFRNT